MTARLRRVVEAPAKYQNDHDDEFGEEGAYTMQRECLMNTESQAYLKVIGTAINSDEPGFTMIHSARYEAHDPDNFLKGPVYSSWPSTLEAGVRFSLPTSQGCS